MMKTLIISMQVLLATFFLACTTEKSDPEIKLIAHRGGVVQDGVPENSREALLKAAEKGYWGVELDMRMTKDSVLITHHDRDFERYYGVDKQVADMNWEEVSALISTSGTGVQTLEEALSLCAELDLNVMIDNKIPGLPIPLFEKLIRQLDELGLRDSALMIGSSASTEYFTGKIALSCSIEQLEQNKLRNDWDPDNYYLFSNPSSDEAEWAKSIGVRIVGVINEWALDKATEMEVAEQIKQNIVTNGIEYVQLDSKYDPLFLGKDPITSQE